MSFDLFSEKTWKHENVKTWKHVWFSKDDDDDDDDLSLGIGEPKPDLMDPAATLVSVSNPWDSIQKIWNMLN